MKNATSIILCTFLALSISTITLASQDNFFDAQAGKREVDRQFRQQLNASNKVIRSLDQMRILIMLEEMRDGDCSGVIDIEEKAKSGDGESLWILGSLYYQGLCVGKDIGKAISYYETSARQDYLEAHENLYYIYNNGEGIDKNTTVAFKHLKAAADSGSSKSQVELAGLYMAGEVIPKNFLTAKDYYERAADLEHVGGYYGLLRLYLSTDLGEPNFEEALKWGILGAENGDVRSQLYVAALQQDLNDNIQAYKWFTITNTNSAEQVKKISQDSLTVLDSILTTQEKLEAQELASNWKPINERLKDPFNVTFPPITQGEIIILNKQEALAKIDELKIPRTEKVFFAAVQQDNREIVELFVKAGASIETEQVLFAGVTPLYIAIDYGSMDVYRFLIDSGANVNAMNPTNGYTPLLRAVAHNRLDVVYELLSLKADAKQKDASLESLIGGASPLMFALDNGDIKLVEALLDAGASVDEKYYNRDETPLIQVGEKCSPSMMKTLIKHGANVNDVDIYGNSVLMQTVLGENSSTCVEILIDNGADAKHKSKSGKNALFNAADHGNPTVIRSLINAGAKPEQRYALKKSNIAMNASPLERELLMNGITPLMLMVYHDHLSSVKIMLEHGAKTNPKVETKEGVYDATTLAKLKGNNFIINLLNQAEK